jgi:hypothetical protein
MGRVKNRLKGEKQTCFNKKERKEGREKEDKGKQG